MIEMPSSLKPDILADWAEASCLFGKYASISEHELEGVLDDAGVQDPDEAVSNIWQEINLRHYAPDGVHPVRSFPGRLERIQDWNKNLAYAFQLLLACQSHYQSTRVTPSYRHDAAKLFERLSTVGLQQYLGGKAINIGTPRDRGVPAKFGDCLDYLCKNLEEMPGFRRSYTSRIRDDGVDVVAWRPFGDTRPGQVIILAQCATGANWRGKTREVSLDKWDDHIDWAAKPFKAFIFPFVCLDRVDWRRLSKEGGLILDRLRITSMFTVANGSSSTVRTVHAELRDWCQKQLPRLPWLHR